MQVWHGGPNDRETVIPASPQSAAAMQMRLDFVPGQLNGRKNSHANPCQNSTWYHSMACRVFACCKGRQISETVQSPDEALVASMRALPSLSCNSGGAPSPIHRKKT